MATASKPLYKRRSRLPMPRLQWKLIGSFVGLSALSLLLQFLLFSERLASLAATLPKGSEVLTQALPSTLGSVLLFSMLVLLPMCAAIGVMITFPWAGPLYRFHAHLRQVAQGTAEGPCRIRKTDELQELCALINQALEATQARASERHAQSAALPSGEDRSAAA